MNVKLYMKSGNQIIINDVVDYSIKYIDNEITSLNIKFGDEIKGKGVIVESIDLSQIEAMESLDG